MLWEYVPWENVPWNPAVAAESIGGDARQVADLARIKAAINECHTTVIWRKDAASVVWNVQLPLSARSSFRFPGVGIAGQFFQTSSLAGLVCRNKRQVTDAFQQFFCISRTVCDFALFRPDGDT